MYIVSSMLDTSALPPTLVSGSSRKIRSFDRRHAHVVTSHHQGRPRAQREARRGATVDTDATEADVIRMLDTADRHSSWLDDLRNPVPLSREVHIVRGQPA